MGAAEPKAGHAFQASASSCRGAFAGRWDPDWASGFGGASEIAELAFNVRLYPQLRVELMATASNTASGRYDVMVPVTQTRRWGRMGSTATTSFERKVSLTVPKDGSAPLIDGKPMGPGRGGWQLVEGPSSYTFNQRDGLRTHTYYEEVGGLVVTDLNAKRARFEWVDKRRGDFDGSFIDHVGWLQVSKPR